MKTEVIPSKNTFQEIHEKLLIPLSIAFKDVEINGFNIDQARVQKIEKLYQDKLIYLVDKIRSFPEVRGVEEKLGKAFNINSHTQVRELFFNEMNLSIAGVSKTDGGLLSTGVETRKLYKGDHDIVGLMDEYNKYETLYKMFVKPLASHIREDGRVHPSYMIHGTVTGRPSCEKPNLMQIPRTIKKDDFDFDFDSELNIKRMYVPTNKDYCIVVADYSQLELRILADYSQDNTMIEAFKAGEDIHLATAKLLAKDDTITKDSHWRHDAKAVNFGIIYGKTAESLSKDLGISIDEAKKFMSIYFEKMPAVETWIKATEDFCIKNGYVSTMFGRLRRLANATSSEKWIKLRALRQAVNSPIQGTAVDFDNCSMIEINNIFKSYSMKSKIVAMVHDNLVFDVHRRELKPVINIIKTVMPNPSNKLIYWNCSVPLEVDIEVGDDWASLESYNN